MDGFIEDVLYMRLSQLCSLLSALFCPSCAEGAGDTPCKVVEKMTMVTMEISSPLNMQLSDPNELMRFLSVLICRLCAHDIVSASAAANYKYIAAPVSLATAHSKPHRSSVVILTHSQRGPRKWSYSASKSSPARNPQARQDGPTCQA